MGRQVLCGADLEGRSSLWQGFCAVTLGSWAHGGLAVGLGCAVLHQCGMTQKFICAFYSQIYSTLIFACTSLDLVVRVVMAYCKSLLLVSCVWCCTYSARPCVMLPFRTHFRPSLLVSSPSSLVMY